MPTNALTASAIAVSTAGLDSPSFNPPVVLSDYTLDNGLLSFPTSCDRIYVCSGPVTDYNSVLAKAVGFKDFGGGYGFGGITNGVPSGRVVTSIPFNDGSITMTGVANCWAAVDDTDQKLLAWGILAQNVNVIGGQLFSLPTFSIHEYSWFAGANIGIALTAITLASQAASLSRPIEKLVLANALSLATSAVVLAAPAFTPGTVLTAFSFQPIRADSIGSPVMVQKHKLTANSIASKVASLGSSGISFLGQYADGSTGAPAGAPQYASLLSAYGTNRPPWNVAGVDYHVGPASGITMLDGSIQANLPAGATANSSTRQVIISGANVTLGSATQGFSFPVDWQIYINTNASGTITLRNIVVVTTTQGQGICCDGNVNLTVYNCEVNQSKYASQASPYTAAGIQYNGSKTFICRYCYIHDLDVDGIQANAGTFDIQYCMIYGLGYTLGDAVGGHPDCFQAVGGSGPITSGTFAFTTCVTVTMANGNQNPLLDIESQLNASVSNIIFANNTLLALGPTGATNSPATIMAGSFVDDTGSTLKGFQFIHNYLDPTGSIWGCYGTPSQAEATVGYPLVYLGNYCMAAFNNGQGDINPLGPYNPSQVGRVPVGSVTATAGPSDSDVWSATANPSTGSIGVGGVITFTITYVRPVNASASSLALNNGATAVYVGGSGTTVLTFSYTVASGDVSVSNIKINAVNGTVTDQFGNTMIESNALVTFTGLNISQNSTNIVFTATSLATRASGVGTPILSSGSAGLVPMPALTTGAGLAQRPVYAAPNLTWQGPVGGGPSNGDYTLQTQALTTSSAMASSSAGQIIQNLHITGNPPLTINHNNVTVRRCHLQITPANSADSYCIDVARGVTGLIVEDCMIDANADSNEGNGICCTADFTVTSATVRRNYFLKCAQIVRFTINNVNVIENYCARWSGGDADFVEVYPNGGVCNNILVQYNYFTGPDNSVAGGDSGVNLSTGAGLPKGTIGPNVVIDTNWFVRTDSPQKDAWQYHSIANGVGGGTGGGTEWLEFTFTNNGIYSALGTPMGNGSILFGTAGSGSQTVGGGLIHDSGNYVMSSPTSRTGTLYQGFNGAGRL